MLTELRIRNLAIIESLTLPLAPGLNVLSGETGAGKSIIVGALGVLLGERASAELVRPGQQRAMVEGIFDCRARPDIIQSLDELGAAADDELIVLRREIGAAGRARAWINDASTTAGSLARIGRLLVTIHGQHETQSLLDPGAQRTILDAFGGAMEVAAQVRAAYERLTGARREILELERRRTEATQRADYLRHVSQEIEGAGLSTGEEERLEEEAARLENADELRTLAGSAAEALEGNHDAVLSRLAAVRRALASARRIDHTLGRYDDALDSAFYTLQELARDLAAYAASVEMDPVRLEEVRQRRDLLHRLTRKYGGTVADVLELARRSREELDVLDTAAIDLRQLDRRRAEAEQELESAAARLSELRQEAAGRLSDAVASLLPALGMADGRFSVLLTPLPEIGADGAEAVEFQVALNIGHEARPLSRVASGGELSRVMLALETILAGVDRIPTLIFDEVDAGIGGKVGLQVGDTMRRVAAHHQVLAITHLPQIASRAHHHVVVTKSARGGVTAADVSVVHGDVRITEIARMLGGDPESSLSREHARELLSSAVPEPASGGTGRAGRRRQMSSS